MWHVSVSLQHPGIGYVLDPARCERIAIDALTGVGGNHEWWLPTGEFTREVAHLRVPTTPAEQALIPAGLVTMDAGTVGVLRPRSR